MMRHRRQKHCSPNSIRSALVILALSLLLAACGGGGGSNNNNDGSESSPMSGSGDGDSGGSDDGSADNNDHSDTPDGATAISLDSAISGTIDSATDVDHFRLGIESEGTLTISTSGNANPDIRVYDADGVEIPGMAGSWIVVIDQSILDKGNYVIVRLSGGTPGESYSAVASFRVDDDSDMGGGTTPIQAIPATFREGSTASVYAQDAADTLDSLKGTPFPALGTAIRRVWTDDGGSTSLTGRAHVSTITENADGGATAVFVVDGQEYQINWPQEKFNSRHPESVQKVGGIEFGLEADSRGTNNNPLNEDYYSFAYWDFFEDDVSYGYDGQIVYGSRTGADLPVGTVRYTGNFFGRIHPATGDPTWRVARRGLWGKIRLEADLDDLTISGEVNGLGMQETQENGNQWSLLPDTTSIAISEGSIAGGRFVTTWAGQDTDPGNPAETSARGFAGDIVGDFYGPNAEEAAGLFNGSRAATGTMPQQVVWGTFGAEKDE